MIVEKDERGDYGSDDDGGLDQFPVGMRVLAVDDDRTCLNILESLLRQCEYHVTSSTQAVMALEMLRENKDKFDLVISDVNMPDMDGFKLLELVGLELDLPVIMMSADCDTKRVMKGIIHGAVDYLVKPVRLEELKNIWQHVIRRKKFEPRGQNNASHQENSRGTLVKAEQGVMGTDDPSRRFNKKRKDQSEDEDEDEDEDEEEEDGEDGSGNEDSSNHKKARVSWAKGLHEKFVVAVHQLGLDKAVPKKILELMNVEGLTRENVASHLQKYRLYLKKSVPGEANMPMAASFGTRDTYFNRTPPLDGFGDFHSLNRPMRHPSSGISGGMLGRFNSPSTLSLSGLATSSIIQNSNSSAYALQGIPTSMSSAQLGHFSRVSDPSLFSGTPSFPNPITTLSSSSNSLSTGNSSLYQPPLAVGEPLSVNPLSVRPSFSNQSNTNWQGPAPLVNFVPGNEPRANFSWTSSGGSLPSSIGSTAHVGDSRGYIQCQPGLMSDAAPILNYNQSSDSLFTLPSIAVNQNNAVSEQIDSGNSLYVPKLRSSEELLWDQSDFESLDDLVNEMIEPVQNNETLMDGEFEFDASILG